MKGVILTYLVTYGGTAVALFNPFVGLLIYVSFALLRPQALWAWALPPGGNYSRIVAFGLLAGWALRGFGDWRFGRAKGIIGALLGFWACILAGAVMAVNQPVGWAYAEIMSKTFLPCIAAMTLIDSVGKIRQLAWVIVLSQGYLAYEFNVQYYTTFFVARDWDFASVDNNGIAITMVTSLGMAFFLGLHAEVWWHKALAYVSAALMAHVILFSESRGGMLSLILTGAVSFLLIPKQPKHYVIFFLAVLLLIRLAGPQITHRFSTTFAGERERDASAQSRVTIWGLCWGAMIEHPVTGLGPAHWPLNSVNYGLTPGKAAHTTWLAVGAELGIPGLSCLLTFYLLCLGRLWPLTRDRRPLSDPWLRALARMTIASLVGFMVSAQFVAVEGLELPYFIAIIGASVLKLDSVGVASPRGIPPMAWEG
jgi:putative inorganic carbon (HCO3(-)) transporter